MASTDLIRIKLDKLSPWPDDPGPGDLVGPDEGTPTSYASLGSATDGVHKYLQDEVSLASNDGLRGSIVFPEEPLVDYAGPSRLQIDVVLTKPGSGSGSVRYSIYICRRTSTDFDAWLA